MDTATLKEKFPGLIIKSPKNFIYKSWHIDELLDGTWEAVRIKPTKYFRASSLEAALKSITRRESESEKRVGENIESLWFK